MIKIASSLDMPLMTNFATKKLYSEAISEWAHEAVAADLDAVEPLMGDPSTTFDVDVVSSALDAVNMRIVSINSGGLFYNHGLTLLHPDESVRKQAFSGLISLIEICHRFDCLLSIGVFRGGALKGQPIASSRDMLVSVLKRACEYAEPLGVTMMLETTNRFEISFLHTTDEGMDIVQRVDSPSLMMLLDMYHLYIEDNDIQESIVKAKRHVRHFHFKDINGSPPGAGPEGLDFRSIIRWIKSIDFDGCVSIGPESTRLPVGAPGSIAWFREQIRTA